MRSNDYKSSSTTGPLDSSSTLHATRFSIINALSMISWALCMTRDCQSCFSNPTHFCFNFDFFLLKFSMFTQKPHSSPSQEKCNSSWFPHQKRPKRLTGFWFYKFRQKKTVYIRILITVLPFTSSLQNPISGCHEIKFLHNSILPLTFVSLFFFPIIKKG